MTKERAQEILNVIDNGEFLIRVKFIRNNSVYEDESQTKITFKIINKYKPIRESKKASKKCQRWSKCYTYKENEPGFWVRIDEKFLVREIKHFDQAKREYRFTEIRQQKINDWKKKIRISDARIQDVAELEKIL
ncbi:29406_t:CDS:2, partial [Racocetra persica]